MISFFNKKQAGYGSARPLEVSQKLQAARPLVIDVREPYEYAQGHIKGSKLIPLKHLPSRLAELGGKDREIIMVCRSGNRSGQAAALLAGLGYKVTNMEGGMIGWQHARLPVEK